MNKKGFTLVELILVITIIALITAITIPGMLKALGSSKEEGGKSIEKLLLHNLELYNTDYKEDIWCLEGNDCSELPTVINLSFKDLLRVNDDIDMGQCLLRDGSSLKIIKNENGTYKYETSIVCSANFPKKGDTNYDSDNNKVLDESYNYDAALKEANVYYQTK